MKQIVLDINENSYYDEKSKTYNILFDVKDYLMENTDITAITTYLTGNNLDSMNASKDIKILSSDYDNDGYLVKIDKKIDGKKIYCILEILHYDEDELASKETV